jgi:hypothetical protein
MAAMDSIASKFREYEYTIKLLTAKLEELAAENESLRSGLGAHGVLKLVYSDDKQPAGVRVKAAQAALNVEKPSLKPQPAPLELVAEEVIPLPQLVEERRARMIKMHAEDPQFQAVAKYHQVPFRSNGDGDDSSSND